ncbi:MAG: hypothetical protein NXH83_06835 [Rhodobacteraceae bacterium]|nr:hypothetical protein [Paracoccaceae bacterium]
MTTRWLFLALFAAPAHAAGAPEAFLAAIDEARATCEVFEQGRFSMRPGALKTADLTGDGSADDWVLDEAYFDCSSAVSLYCGTGGCAIDFAVGETTTQAFGKGWAAADDGGRRVIYLNIHGSGCGGTNLDPCFQKMMWTGAAFALFPPQGG